MSSQPDLFPATASALPTDAALMLLQWRLPDGNPERAEQAIEAARVGWQSSSNPIFPCMAWEEARAAGLPVPEWVLGYFDDATARIRALSIEAPKADSATAAGEAFGFKTAGRGTVFTRATDMSWIYWGWLVDLRVAQGEKPYLAVEDVAALLKGTTKQAPSSSTVWRAWERYRRLT